MKKTVDQITAWVYRATDSSKFFVATLMLLGVQAVWLVFSAIYPLPFDEFVHFGEIQLYAKQWLPFIADQSASASIFGDITREPSFLYYYLMSFPYRFFDLFTNNEMALVIAMRLINVAFVVGGTILFRKLLLSWGISRRIVNIALVAFAATPIVPFVAAHVNYDNLMFLLAPIFLMVATRLIIDNKDFVRRLLLFAFFGLTTVLVKRTFLPLAGIVGIYVLIVIWKRNGKNIFKVIGTSWKKTNKGLAFFVLCIGLILSLGLFAERYGGNVVNYGSIWPECHQIQSRDVCAEWGPWRRDNIGILESRPSRPGHNVVTFSGMWVVWMMRGYFAIFSHASDGIPRQGDPFGPIQARDHLPLPIAVADVTVIFGVVAIIWQRKKIWRQPYLRFGLVVCSGFILAQLFFNYQTYRELWRAVAIQARYTYPILIILFALMIQAGDWWIKSHRIKVGLLVLFAPLYVWGGGIAGWIIRSPDTWHWQNSVVQTVNHGARDVLRYLVIH